MLDLLEESRKYRKIMQLEFGDELSSCTIMEYKQWLRKFADRYLLTDRETLDLFRDNKLPERLTCLQKSGNLDPNT